VGLLTEVENDIRAKEAAIGRLQEQISQLRKVAVNAERAMTEINKEEECQAKLRAINDEVRKAKANARTAQDKQKELDRANQEQHRAIMDMEDRCRRLTQLIAQKKSAQSTNLRRLSE
jgi:chromosome segregation ATPase